MEESCLWILPTVDFGGIHERGSRLVRFRFLSLKVCAYIRFVLRTPESAAVEMLCALDVAAPTLDTLLLMGAQILIYSTCIAGPHC